jgi:hypothetical protein
MILGGPAAVQTENKGKQRGVNNQENSVFFGQLKAQLKWLHPWL